MRRHRFAIELLASLFVLLTTSVFAHEANKDFAAPSEEGAQTMKKFKLPAGLTVDLWAAEPMLAHPVALCVDEKGRVYVSQTFRFSDGISGGGDKDYGALDMRGHMDWLEQDLSNKTVEDRVAMLKRNMGEKVSLLQRNPERVQFLEDKDGDGKADSSTIFSEDFKEIADGAAEGILAYKGNVYFTNIPHLWLLRDENGDGKADVKKSLAYGFGPRIAFLGHDLHGLVIGPDRKLYYSVGDRGYHVEQNGKVWHGHEWGAVFRSELDGSNFEVFCTGLRNPQELAFDDYGNLWTADNNADKGDPARWVYLVEGGDSGWRGGYQYISWPNNLGPWLSEKLCHPPFDGQAAFIVPPVGTIGAGPSGLCYYPGTGLDDSYKGHFFECDFRGESGGVWDLSHQALGAGFKMNESKQFFWNVQATDICFAPDGSMLSSVWVGGIGKGGKGRIYKIRDPKFEKDPVVLEVKKLLGEGFDKRSVEELTKLLGHKDQRVRQEAQFALVDKGDAKSFATALASTEPMVRIQAIWGLGVLARAKPAGIDGLVVPLLKDKELEVRVQALRVLGDLNAKAATGDCVALLKDENARARYFAAMALGKLGAKESIPAIAEMLRGDSKDPWLRHSVIFAFEKLADDGALATLAKDENTQVRLAACVAMRRLGKAQIAEFLNDKDPLVVLEAARAIAEVPIDAALPALAAMLPKAVKETDEKLMPRMVSACNKLGKTEHAEALAEFAAKNDLPEKPRTMALKLLLKWAKPDGKDSINGLWRPLAERDGNVAREALKKRIDTLLASNGMVKDAVCDAVEAYKITEAGAPLLATVSDEKQQAAARARALKALAAIGDAKTGEALEIALKAKEDLVRKEAQRIKAQMKPNEGAAVLAEILNKKESSQAEKQGALQTLAGLKDAKADTLSGEWLKKLNAGQTPEELQLEILEAAAGRAALKDEIAKYQAGLKADDLVKDYRDTLKGGDLAAGKKVFIEKTEAQCMRCHRIGSDGGEAGPQLGDIGKRTTREYILESIVAPNHKIAAGFETLIVKLTDGKIHVGIKKGETETELDLLCPPDTRVKVSKKMIASTKTGPSSMPEDLVKLLTKRDLRNLVEFLASQK